MIDYYKNKQVWIFGGSTGIGFETACQLTERGADVRLFARRKKVLITAVDRIKTANILQANQSVVYTVADVTLSDALQKIIDDLVKENGCPEIVINCAGAAFPNYFENITAEQFESTFKLNVFGVRNIAAAIVPHMKKQGRGHLINTSSVAGYVGTFGYTDYSASKFAIVGFSEALQAEVKPHNITISILYPPDTYTEGFEEEEKTKPIETRAISANNKPVQPEVIARALLKKIPKKQFHIIPTFDSWITYIAKRFIPGVVTWVMDRDIKNVQSRKQ